MSETLLDPAYLQSLTECVEDGNPVPPLDVRKLIRACWFAGAEIAEADGQRRYCQNLLEDVRVDFKKLTERIGDYERAQAWLMPCGHPPDAQVPREGDVPFCAWCAEISFLQERIDLLLLADVKRRTPTQLSKVPNAQVLAKPAAAARTGRAVKQSKTGAGERRAARGSRKR